MMHLYIVELGTFITYDIYRWY